MADFSTAMITAALSNLVSVRPVASNVADASQQAGNTLRAQLGQLVQGTIFGMNSDGEPLLKSEQGNLALKLPFHLPSGVEVVLRMEAAASGMRARILSLDGLPLKDYIAQIGNSGQAPQAPTQDIVSVPQNLAQAMIRPSTPQAQQQLANQQIAVMPGETNPALTSNAQKIQAGIAPLPTAPDAALTRLIQVANDPINVLLLSRNPQFAEITSKLPADIPLPPRLMPGMQLQIQLVAVEKLVSQAEPLLQATSPAPSGNAPVTSQPSQPQAAPSSFMPSLGLSPQANASPLALNQMLGKLAAQQQAREIVPTLLSANTANLLQPGKDAAQPVVPHAATPTTTPQAPVSPTIQVAQSLQNIEASLSGDALMQPVAASIQQAAAKATADATDPSELLPLPGNNPAAKGEAAVENRHTTKPTFITPPQGIPADAKGTFGGQVIDVDANSGEALIQTVFGVVRMPPSQSLSLQEGDRVQWVLQGFLPPMHTPVASRPADAFSQLLALATGWSSLEDTLDWLTATHALQSAVSIGPQALVGHLPKPDAKMGAAIIFMIAALRRNEPQSWIGRTTVEHLVEKGRTDLLSALEADFTLLRQPLVDSPSPNWQALFFPVWADQQLHQARLFIHQNPDEEKEKNAQKRGGDIRFVLELELSALGNMQLCGLVRHIIPAPQPALNAPATPAPSPIHFDLAVRSLHALSPQRQQDIREIFQQGAELTGYQGQILFQHMPSFPDSPMESFASAMPGWTA